MNQAPASVWRNPIHFLAFGLGSGASPWAPGTAGTLAAIPLFLLIQPLSLVWYVAFLLVTFLVGIYLCGQTSKDMGVHDHGGIVWDEFVGYWITMLAAPPGWLWIAIGFVLFRLFDIIKPWPISWADKKVAGGLGIMLDDVLAGLMALICLQLLTRLV
ncbi:phosphatidylglycerophosphatase A [Amphritea pacifica]|uniref:Phosphatidylglycerophosphatase A n=1 Tax=Amphritea pacifica TaxID=2811233 RepID=A0ABS2W3I8_9GAMM|nr:phosphatidylglycerophosphatase A [Amphritea pacifica]MBN0986285.1 phosphatidylglycerophosphatase A [Amphritea pacifica]MBN1006976.1 phosphatidylglycerophosphatase A [Amphritea pacifica]